MEGYFPIQEYCKLAGVSEDTAYHRAIRNSIPSFEDKDGRKFLYFCNDAPDIPEGWCTLKEFAEMHNVNRNTVYKHIRKGHIPNDCVKKVTLTGISKINGPGTIIIIQKDVPYTDMINYRQTEYQTQLIKALSPDGYIPAAEFAKANGLPRYRIYNDINRGFILSIKSNGHIYVPNNLTMDTIIENRRARKEWSRKLRQQARKSTGTR